MSFETMGKPELQAVCEEYGIEIDAKTKAQLLADLLAEGVNYDDYQKLKEAPKVDVEEVLDPAVIQQHKAQEALKENRNDEEDVLVKMERKNMRYDLKGFTFTNEHPYVVMGKTQAQEIFDAQDGFRLATPREVESFYN